jgi:hypothetical protein
MHRIVVAFSLCALLFAYPRLDDRQNEKEAGNRQVGQHGGDREQVKTGSGTAKASDPRWNVHVRLLRNNAPAAARVSIVGSDGTSYGPSVAATRATKRGVSYFYANDSFNVKLPAGRVRMNVSGGLETIPQMVTVDAEAATDVTVQMQHWVDMAARSWYSGDSHVHLHTGGPIAMTVEHVLVATRAEGVIRRRWRCSWPSRSPSWRSDRPLHV